MVILSMKPKDAATAIQSIREYLTTNARRFQYWLECPLVPLKQWQDYPLPL